MTQSAPLNLKIPFCDMCIKPSVTKYESCQLGKSNSYMHAEINAIRDRDPQHPVSQLLANRDEARYIKEDCFQGSLTNFGGPYSYCAKGQERVPPRSVPRSCADEQYTGLVRKSFDAVGDCLGDYLAGNSATAKEAMVEMFGLLSLESGLNINSRSAVANCTADDVATGRHRCTSTTQRKAGGAGGPGQLTEGAINAVNRTELNLMKNHLATKMENPLCKLVLDQLNNPMNSRIVSDCDRISVSKGNPLKNFIYSVSYQKILRSEVRGFHFRSTHTKRVFQSLSTENRDYLERQLGIWSHNSGAGALNQAMSVYLRNYIGKALVTKKDVDDFLKNMRPYMRRSNSGRVNVEEPVNFWNRIKTRVSDLDKTYGRGSCVIGN